MRVVVSSSSHWAGRMNGPAWRFGEYRDPNPTVSQTVIPGKQTLLRLQFVLQAVLTTITFKGACRSALLTRGREVRLGPFLKRDVQAYAPLRVLHLPCRLIGLIRIAPTVTGQ